MHYTHLYPKPITTSLGSSYSSISSLNKEVSSRKINIAKNINISPLYSGFLLTIGTYSFAVETQEKMLEQIASYLKNPIEIEETWAK